MGELTARCETPAADIDLGTGIDHVLEVDGREFGRVEVDEVADSGRRYVEIVVPTSLRPEDMTADFVAGFRAAVGVDERPDFEWLMWAGTLTAGWKGAFLSDHGPWQRAEGGLALAGDHRVISFNCGNNTPNWAVEVYDGGQMAVFTTGPVTPELMTWVAGVHRDAALLGPGFDAAQASRTVHNLGSDAYVSGLRAWAHGQTAQGVPPPRVRLL